MSKYKIAEGKTPEELRSAVNDLMKEGYKPQGGVSVCFIRYLYGKGEEVTKLLYSQAMVPNQ